MIPTSNKIFRLFLNAFCKRAHANRVQLYIAHVLYYKISIKLGRPMVPKYTRTRSTRDRRNPYIERTMANHFKNIGNRRCDRSLDITFLVQGKKRMVQNRWLKNEIDREASPLYLRTRSSNSRNSLSWRIYKPERSRDAVAFFVVPRLCLSPSALCTCTFVIRSMSFA